MPGIGDTLREARMRQGLDIVDVEGRTKIRAKYLRALENEEFSLLPGSTFVKTFLRTYAELLGLDPHPLLDAYRAQHEADGELEPAPLGPPAGGRERERRGPPGPPRPGMVLLFAVVGVLGLLLVLGLTGGDDEGEPAARTETTARPRTTTAPEKAKPPAPKGVTLRIRPTEPTYACIDTGAGTDVVFEGVLDSARTFRGKRVRVNLGKTSVALRANGKAVPLERGPNPAGFDFTPRRTRALPLGQRPCA